MMVQAFNPRTQWGRDGQIPEFKVSLDLQNKFQDSWGYMEKPYAKIKCKKLK